MKKVFFTLVLGLCAVVFISAQNSYNPTTKIKVAEDNAVVLDNNWDINFDFKNFLVELTGGDITNNRAESYDNLVLDVFLTKDNNDLLTKDFPGLRIASAKFQGIKGNKKFVKTKVTSGLTAVPALPGDYYVLLTLSTVDSEGNVIARSKRVSADRVSFKK